MHRTATQHTGGGTKKGGVIKITTTFNSRAADATFTQKAMLEQRRLFAGRQHNTLLQGFNICWETCDGTKNSPGLDAIIAAEAACHRGSDYRSKRCVSNRGVNLNGDGRPAGRTGLNSYFIILLSTNKLKPVKTSCCEGPASTSVSFSQIAQCFYARPHSIQTPAVRYSGKKLQM